jgi:hypothetical protein
MEDELKFLRYFYNQAGLYMGPSNDDIYQEMKEWYRDNVGPLPEGDEYALYEEDE